MLVCWVPSLVFRIRFSLIFFLIFSSFLFSAWDLIILLSGYMISNKDSLFFLGYKWATQNKGKPRWKKRFFHVKFGYWFVWGIWCCRIICWFIVLIRPCWRGVDSGWINLIIWTRLRGNWWILRQSLMIERKFKKLTTWHWLWSCSILLFQIRYSDVNTSSIYSTIIMR